MKTLYFQCNMGAAGDMLTAALYELLPDKEAFLETLNSLGLPGIVIKAEKSEKCGVTGTHMSVSIRGEEEGAHSHHHSFPLPGRHHHHHAHAGLAELTERIAALPLSEKVRSDALAVYASIAEAESHVHGKAVEDIHFHEVGSLDALADVVGVCYALDLLAPDEILCSPIHVGSGTVRCAHGVLPVPAPATEYLLRGVPTYSGAISGELCTPTGAALLKHFVKRFCALPVMRVESTGYGMGKKDFPEANCVRAMLGETEAFSDEMTELRCNLDDMTAEEIAFACEELLAAGAADVWCESIVMKKSRPGTMLCCLCAPDRRETMLTLLFRHTTTLGVREQLCRRTILHRELSPVETPYGTIRVKRASGMGTEREKAEYEDLARAAREHGVPLDEVRRAALSGRKTEWSE